MSFNLKTYKLSPALTKEYTQAHLLKTFHIQIKLISIYKRKVPMLEVSLFSISEMFQTIKVGQVFIFWGFV